MGSLILRTATLFLQPVLLLFAVLLFVGGHDQPGGGFVAGLVAATGFVLLAFAKDVHAARRALRVPPVVLIGSGIGLILASGCVGLLRGQPFLTGAWGRVLLPGGASFELGSPLVFDLGVLLAVWGTALTVVFAKVRED